MNLAEAINANYAQMLDDQAEADCQRVRLRQKARLIREWNGRDAADTETPAELTARLEEVEKQTAAIVAGNAAQEEATE